MSCCRTCKFSVAGGVPHCRFSPPHVTGENQSAFPVVSLDNHWWCGQHRFSVIKWLKAKWRKHMERVIPL